MSWSAAADAWASAVGSLARVGVAGVSWRQIRCDHRASTIGERGRWSCPMCGLDWFPPASFVIDQALRAARPWLELGRPYSAAMVLAAYADILDRFYPGWPSEVAA